MNALRTRFKAWWPDAVIYLRRFARPVEGCIGDRLWLLISLGGVFLLTGGWLLAAQADYQIAREHGPMENLQAVFLVVGLLTLLLQAWLEKASGARVTCATLGWAYFIFFLLEFDLRPFQMQWTSWLNGAPRDGALALGSLALGVWIIRNSVEVRKRLLSSLRTFWPALMAASGAFWLAGNVAEHSSSLSRATSLFLEELMETNASWLMLMAALYFNQKR